jgi:phosphate transport system substrate-binding protein
VEGNVVKAGSGYCILVVSALALTAGAVTACKSGGNGSGTVVISGAGSTFVHPLMTRWIQDFSQVDPNVQINYQAIGSGSALDQQMRSRMVDFGVSDAALNDQQLGEMQPVIQIPGSAGPVCVIYNLAGLTQPLKLSPGVLAGLFLGTIKNWQDAAVAKDNPGVKLPQEPVVVSHRADGSGTTNIFTAYLAAVSPEWQHKVGKGTSVSWPVGIGGTGSEGMTENVRQSPGAIGYVQLIYAEQAHLPTAAIRNAGGQYVQPTGAGTTAALNAFAAQLSQDPRSLIVNPPPSAADAYPISGMTFLVIPKDGPDRTKRAALKRFIEYLIMDGQATAGNQEYAPLPDALKQYDQQQVGQLAAAGQALP